MTQLKFTTTTPYGMFCSEYSSPVIDIKGFEVIPITDQKCRSVYIHGGC